jgi:hypothetical protein
MGYALLDGHRPSVDWRAGGYLPPALTPLLYARRFSATTAYSTGLSLICTRSTNTSPYSCANTFLCPIIRFHGISGRSLLKDSERCAAASPITSSCLSTAERVFLSAANFSNVKSATKEIISSHALSMSHKYANSRLLGGIDHFCCVQDFSFSVRVSNVFSSSSFKSTRSNRLNSALVSN